MNELKFNSNNKLKSIDDCQHHYYHHDYHYHHHHHHCNAKCATTDYISSGPCCHQFKNKNETSTNTDNSYINDFKSGKQISRIIVDSFKDKSTCTHDLKNQLTSNNNKDDPLIQINIKNKFQDEKQTCPSSSKINIILGDELSSIIFNDIDFRYRFKPTKSVEWSLYKKTDDNKRELIASSKNINSQNIKG
jgi:hypothetical protein